MGVAGLERLVPMPLSLVMLFFISMAAWRDIATRTIPNVIALLLLPAGVLLRTFDGASSVAVSAVTALLLFIFLLALHARSLIGGGDVKFAAAVAFGLSPFDTYRFLISTAIAGSLLGLAYLLLSRVLPQQRLSKSQSLLLRVVAVEAWRIRRRGPLPYAVAIAAGAAFVLLHPGGL